RMRRNRASMCAAEDGYPSCSQSGTSEEASSSVIGRMRMLRRLHASKRSGGRHVASPRITARTWFRSNYRFTSLLSFAGSPDGLFGSAEQPDRTRDRSEMLHWSSTASASMLPTAAPMNDAVGGAFTAGVSPQARVPESGLACADEYLNVSTEMPFA